MIKTLCALALSTVAYVTAQAQTSPIKKYDFSYITGGTYQHLSNNATEIALAIDWDDEISATISMPINFIYQGIAIQNFAVETYGSIILNENTIDEDGTGNIMGIKMDYESKGRGQIYYETTGTAPNRILKIEFRNVGRYNDMNNVDTFNFQTWLYETTNVIEYHVGYSNIPASAIAQNINDIDAGLEPIITGLLTTNDNQLNPIGDENNMELVQYLSNSYSDTIYRLVDIYDEIVEAEQVILTKIPNNGDVFRFALIDNTPPTSINNNNALQATIAPNPSNNGIFTITTKPGEKQFEVYNVIGQRVMGGTSNAINFQVDLSKMSKGNYLLKLKQDGAEANKKLIIK